MPDWVEPVLRMVTTVLLLVALGYLIRNDLRLRKTQRMLAATQETQAEVNQALERLRDGVCFFADEFKYVDGVAFGAGGCSGRVMKRVIADWGVTRTLKTCDAHALTAVNYVHASAEHEEPRT